MSPPSILKLDYLAGLCDFQYLPLVPKDGNGLENIYDDLFPKDLVGKDWLS